MKKINNDIRDQFGFYTELVEQPKIIHSDIIILTPRANNIYWLTGSSRAEHTINNEELTLIVERSKRENKYGVKLRCQTLVEEPYIRFDSDGPAHRNDDPSIPLEEQVITTPHFNAYASDGRSIAYKTDVLKDVRQAAAIVNDINFGLAHFCSETQSSLENGNLPTVQDQEPELGLDNDDSDPLSNLAFD